MVRTNELVRQLLRKAEGLRLDAYQDKKGVWTIGYGHTGDVKPGDHISALEAEQLFERDLEHFEGAIEKLAPNANDNQFSALVSLAFNVGDGEVKKSRLLRKFLAGDLTGAANEFVWFEPDGTPHGFVHLDGVVDPGLVNRRQLERTLFLTPSGGT